MLIKTFEVHNKHVEQFLTLPVPLKSSWEGWHDLTPTGQFLLQKQSALSVLLRHRRWNSLWIVVFNLSTLKLIIFWDRLENMGNGHLNCFQIGICHQKVVVCRSVVPVGWCATVPGEVCWGTQGNIKLVGSEPLRALLRSAIEAGPFSPEDVGLASLEISTSPPSILISPELNQPYLE